MRTSEKSLLAFAVYLVGMGLGLVAMPGLVLGLLGFPPVTDVWSRVVGLLALLLAFYYFQAARAGVEALVRWSVPGRVAVALGFAALVAAGQAGPMLIGLGLVDLAGALWTAWALRREAQPAVARARAAKV
jgi:hypothetical protein